MIEQKVDCITALTPHVLDFPRGADDGSRCGYEDVIIRLYNIRVELDVEGSILSGHMPQESDHGERLWMQSSALGITDTGGLYCSESAYCSRQNWDVGLVARNRLPHDGFFPDGIKMNDENRAVYGETVRSGLVVSCLVFRRWQLRIDHFKVFAQSLRTIHEHVSSLAASCSTWRSTRSLRSRHSFAMDFVFILLV